MIDLNTVILSDTPRGIRAAASFLRAGEQVAFPTETVYGLGANACNDRAVAGIFAAKGRPGFNPLIVHVADLSMAEALAEFHAEARALADAFWPGPLTLVLPVRPETGLSERVTAGLGTVGLRIPAHPLAHRLIEATGAPLAAPSANPSGKVSPTTAVHVLEGLRGRIAGIIDGGPCEVGVESTILGFDGDRPVLLRSGGLPREALSAALGQPVDIADTGPVISPGQLASHYAPGADLRLNASAPEPGEIWIGFGPASCDADINLSPAGDLHEAAATLFASLHEADALAREKGAARIAVAPVPETGIGAAINDRLRRASAPRDT